MSKENANFNSLENVGMLDRMQEDFTIFKLNFGNWQSPAFIWARWMRSN